MDIDELRLQLHKSYSLCKSQENSILIASRLGSQLVEANAELIQQVKRLQLPNNQSQEENKPFNTKKQLRHKNSIEIFHHVTNLELKNSGIYFSSFSNRIQLFIYNLIINTFP